MVHCIAAHHNDVDPTTVEAVLVQAADAIMDAQSNRLAIQKRIQADMREIWFMQPRFERASPKAIWRMIEHPRFRAAVDFLQLRAASHEVDSVHAQWWMDLANADPEDRGELIEQYQGVSTSSKRRRRRPRRKPAGAAADVH